MTGNHNSPASHSRHAAPTAQPQNLINLSYVALGIDSGVATAQVNFAGNLGWLALSPVIGGVATAFSLPLALGLLPPAALGISALAPVTGPRKELAEKARH
jgi:hypothetical protein